MFLDLFGVQIPFLRVVQSFGFFVAISFVLAHYTMYLELKRKEKEGILSPSKVKMMLGKPYPISEYVISGFMGFILGYKLLPVLFMSGSMEDPRSFLLSTDGNWIMGILVATALVFYKKYEDKKQQLTPPQEKEVKVHPYQMIGNLTIIAAVSGLIGAKVFHNLAASYAETAV